MLESFIEIEDKLLKALKETAFMSLTSLALSVLIGLALGLILYITSEPLLKKNNLIYETVGFIANTISSIPFLILMIFFLPISAFIVGTKIGSKAVLVPLTVAAAAFFARLAEASFSDVDKGVLEAVIASGAKKSHVIFKIVLPEAKVSLIKNITVTAVSVLGFSAMAGLVGGGGIGDLAYRYGYQRYKKEVMIICILVLIILVQLIQKIGDVAVRVISKRGR
ncbi:MAG: ABC transporter permease subunit [Lachnospiraceae bacterium]|jgi:D-methionine transport system permease protein|nr:ABC transporter permease subunit [Lachnospiraceae bacterium]